MLFRCVKDGFQGSMVVIGSPKKVGDGSKESQRIGGIQDWTATAP